MAKSKAPVPTSRMEIEYWSPSKPKPYARNARIISEEAVDALCVSLKEFGFKQPAVVDKDGVLVIGHTRVRAALKLGLKEIPVVVARDLSPQKIRQLRIMDNRSAQNTTWDSDVLKEELGDMLKDVDGSNEDLAMLTGFGTSEIDTVIGTMASGTPGLDPKGKGDGDDEDKAPVRPDAAGTCACPRCGFKWTPGGTGKVKKADKIDEADRKGERRRKKVVEDDDDSDDDEETPAPLAPKKVGKKPRFDIGGVPEE